jgi:pilus assembly protein FimV
MTLCDQEDVACGRVAVMGRSATKRLCVQLLTAGAGLWPMLSLALGLGEIQLDSRLNQPLRARIEVLDVNDEEWAQVHARLNWQSAPDIPVLRPEMLDAVSIRTIQDASHRHFVEIRSTRPVAEPLFDLPVEVAGPSGRVIRSFSVLLDPPAPGDDQPGAVEVASSPGTPDSPKVAVGSHEPRSSPGVATRTAHRQRAAANSSPQPATRSSSQEAAQSSSQQELVKQLELLRQTLANMQATISAQNAQIADLTAKVAARASSQAPQPVPAALPGSQSVSSQTTGTAGTRGMSGPAADDGSDADESNAASTPNSYFWLTVALGLTTIAAMAWAILTRWRLTRPAKKSSPEYRGHVEQRAVEATGRADRSDVVKPIAAAPVAMTPAAQQRQMEADGRVQIDWEKELWSKAEWARLFGEQHSGPPESTATHPEATAPPVEATTPPLEATESLPKAYFGELPKVAANPETMTVKLPTYVREDNTAKLTEIDPTELLQADTTQLSETEAARLLAADLANITESELPNLTETDLVELAKADAAKLNAAEQQAPDRQAAEIPDPPKVQRRASRR